MGRRDAGSQGHQRSKKLARVLGERGREGIVELYIKAHARQIAIGHPPPLRSQDEFGTEGEYLLYLRGVRSRPPHVERRDGKYVIRWSGRDEIEWEPDEEAHTLCAFVQHECLAASMTFENGAPPGGIPWDQQPWWRMQIWHAFQAGKSASYNTEPTEEEQQQELEWVRLDEDVTGADDSFPLGRVVKSVAARPPRTS